MALEEVALEEEAALEEVALEEEADPVEEADQDQVEEVVPDLEEDPQVAQVVLL